METSVYDDANNLLSEPAIKWWDIKVLKNKDRIISRVESHYWRTSHKFGIDLPHSVDEAYFLNEENRNTFWWYAIGKKLKKIQGVETFEMMEGVKPEDILSQKNNTPVYK